MSKIEQQVEKLVTKPIENLGYKLYDVEYVKEGKDYYLRIFIESEKGIDLNDCEKVNNEISSLLDEADYIKKQYFLEVSSTGIEKTLRKDKHLEEHLQEKIQINLFKAIEGKKQIEGTLTGFDKENIEIDTEGITKKIPRDNISLIKTVYDW